MNIDPRHADAMRRFDRINEEFASGRGLSARRLQQLLDRTVQLIAALDGLPRSRQRLDDTALAHQLRAEIYFSMGDMDAGLDAAFAACDLFEQAGGSSETFGRFLHDLAVQLNHLNARELALKYARQAKEVLAPYGEPYRRDLAAFVSRLEEGTDSVSADRIRELRRDFDASRGGRRAASAMSLAIALIQSEASAQSVDEIHGLLALSLREALDVSDQGVERPVGVLGQLIELYFNDLPLPPWTPGAIAEVLSAARDADRDDLVAEALTAQAYWQLSQRQLGDAFSTAVTAVAGHETAAVKADTSLVRLLTGKTNHYGRLAALTAACALGKSGAAAELIECARRQVQPAEATTGHRAHAPTSRVGHLHRITVDGRSCMPADEGLPTIALEHCIAAVGGSNAAWWGLWSLYGRAFWALFLRDQWSGGMLPLGEEPPLRDLLPSLWEQSPMTPSASPFDILRGPLCATVGEEIELSDAIGRALIPQALQEALADALFDNRPLSLVVAGNLAAMLPLACLGFKTPDRRVARLIEAAIIRIAPPAVLVNAIAPDDGLATSYPCLLACAARVVGNGWA